MSDIEKILKTALIEKLGVPPGNFRLAMAEPVEESIGNVSNPEETVNLIINKVIQDMPPEISNKGSVAIKVYFASFSYNDQKELLVNAVNQVKSTQK